MPQTELVFRDDAYARSCEARVTRVEPGAIHLDRTVFYPSGGGQPGDRGVLKLSGGVELEVLNTVKGDAEDDVVHVVAEDAPLPEVDTAVVAEIDWERRHKHMRMHTCLHLLCSVIDAPVTGGQLSEDKGRLDFDLQEMALDKAEIQSQLNALIAQNASAEPRWISDEELAAQPELVRTMQVKPPMGRGRVRLMEVAGVDLQPCGGTHVRATGEIGSVVVRKIESKGKHNRRVSLAFADS